MSMDTSFHHINVISTGVLPIEDKIVTTEFWSTDDEFYSSLIIDDASQKIDPHSFYGILRSYDVYFLGIMHPNFRQFDNDYKSIVFSLKFSHLHNFGVVEEFFTLTKEDFCLFLEYYSKFIPYGSWENPFLAKTTPQWRVEGF